jgi:hypothetical protein
MPTTKRWDVDIYIDEHDDTTRAEARLRTRDDTHLMGIGTAHRNPHDVDVPEIGDEVATARALAMLSQKLMRAATEDVEGMTHEPAHLAL